MTRGARGGLVMLVMGRWEAWGGSQAGPRFKKEIGPKSLWGLAEY